MPSEFKHVVGVATKNRTALQYGESVLTYQEQLKKDL